MLSLYLAFKIIGLVVWRIPLGIILIGNGLIINRLSIPIGLQVSQFIPLLSIALFKFLQMVNVFVLHLGYIPQHLVVKNASDLIRLQLVGQMHYLFVKNMAEF
uniref:ATP synthase F0 subunit 6 n=1 Tax=Acrobeloides nanus TaxID=290746 RepID=A0A914CEA6_9BILA